MPLFRVLSRIVFCLINLKQAFALDNNSTPVRSLRCLLSELLPSIICQQLMHLFCRQWTLQISTQNYFSVVVKSPILRIIPDNWFYAFRSPWFFAATRPLVTAASNVIFLHNTAKLHRSRLRFLHLLRSDDRNSKSSDKMKLPFPWKTIQPGSPSPWLQTGQFFCPFFHIFTLDLQTYNWHWFARR